MKANLRGAALLLALLGAGPALACFTVYDRNNNVVYNASTPPVDMSRPLHETLPAVFPGGHLVFDGQRGDCPVVSTAGRTNFSSNGRTPLLTDAETARSMGLPHTVVRSNVAVVPDTPDTMRPGVMVVDSGLGNAANDTRMMGAGRAPQRAPGTVITEMHNPPLTAVQRGR